MVTGTTVVVPTVNGAARLERLLRSLGDSSQVIVVDNGSRDGTADLLARGFPAVEVVRLDRNEGFSRAVNAGARRADCDALVLLNDDCIVEPEFARTLAAALDPSSGIVMAAGVLCEAGDPSVIDTAGMELDRTLLVFDYLNGRPVSVLDADVPDPIGPCAAAAAFDRSAFLDVDGFDESLFAYWEDVDLVLRLRLAGGRCALVKEARGTHAHSATLSPGSSHKNYLTGFGRSYVLRKWGALSARRLPAILGRELVICGGQLVVDRNAAGVRGRIAGFRAAAAAERHAYPAGALGDGQSANLRRRLGRRRRLARAEA